MKIVTLFFLVFILTTYILESATYETRPFTKIEVTAGEESDTGIKTADSQVYTDQDGYLTGYDINCDPAATFCFALSNGGTKLDVSDLVVPPSESATNHQGHIVNDPPTGGN